MLINVDLMPGKQEEEKLLFVSIGVVFFSVLAVVLFMLNVQIVFYISALLAIALGFYLSRSLSNADREPLQKPAGRKPRQTQGS
jgi:membrane protein implicated in regulation of membrane protease activity